MRGRRMAAALALVAAAGGCTLTDVTVAPGEDRVVVVGLAGTVRA